MKKQLKNNKISSRVIGLAIGIFLNTLGNGLTISSNAGSPVYTASSVGLANVSQLSVSIFLFAWGFLSAILNQILLKRIDIIRFVKGIIYMFLFSYFAGFFSNLITKLGIGHQSLFIRIIVSLIGIICIGMAISFNQRANIMMHPNDDTTNILRFHYMHGSAPWAQVTDLTPPVVVILLIWFFSGHLYAVGLATFCFFIFIGFVIKYTDRLIWPGLIHNFSNKDREKNKIK